MGLNSATIYADNHNRMIDTTKSILALMVLFFAAIIGLIFAAVHDIVRFLFKKLIPSNS